MGHLVSVSAKIQAKGNLDLPRLLKEWPERSRAMRNYIVYLAAKYVHDQMLDKIPKKDEWRAYRMGLTVGMMMGGEPGSDVFAVYVDPKHRKVRSLNVQRTLIFVKPRRKSRRPKKEVALLEKYNPWTFETMPFQPSKADAIIVHKKVSQTTIDRVTKQKKKILRTFTKELSKIGHRAVNKRNKLKVSRRLKKIPDVVMSALKLEFGLGTDKAKPHWRPAIRKLLRSGFREFRRSHHALTYAMTRSNFQGWRKWPPRVRHRVRMNDVRLFKNFQQKLGIRID
jgi:hypothetical protein